MVGPPGAGKSMLAARLPPIVSTLSPAELLEVSMIASVAGEIADVRSLPLRTRERSGLCLPARTEHALFGGISDADFRTIA